MARMRATQSEATSSVHQASEAIKATEWDVKPYGAPSGNVYFGRCRAMMLLLCVIVPGC